MLCVASHDAGGAELLASWVAQREQPCHLLLDGPALIVFKRRLGYTPKIVSFEQALDECDNFLTGSSWQSELEWQVICDARAQGKPVVTFLDHWGHYRERFFRNGKQCLPNVIWTGDKEAFVMAKAVFPEVAVEQVPNPYFEDVRKAVADFSEKVPFSDMASNCLRILFVCEPLSEHGMKEFGDPMHWGYTEFEALRYFFSHLSLLGGSEQIVVIRPHPSEKAGKYDAIARELAVSTGIYVRVGGDSTLLQEIAGCDLVVGCESMAMVVGLIAGRRVVSAIPPGGLPCSLPHKQIESLQVIAMEGLAKTQASACIYEDWGSRAHE